MVSILFAVTKLGDKADNLEKLKNGKKRNRTTSEGHLKSAKPGPKKRHRSEAATEPLDNLKRLTTLLPQKKPKCLSVAKTVKQTNGDCVNEVGGNSCDSGDVAEQRFDETSDAVQSAALSLLQLVKEGSQFGLEDATDSNQVGVGEDTKGGTSRRRRSASSDDKVDSIAIVEQQQDVDCPPEVMDATLEETDVTPEWVKKQSGRKPLVQCRICRVKLKDYRYLFKHLKSRHGGHKDLQACLEEVQPKKRVPCPMCNKPMLNHKTLSVHIRQFHAPPAAVDVVCTICKLSLPNQAALQQHAKKCGRQRYSCGDCGSTFSAIGCLEEHMTTAHRAATMFSCDACHKAFVTRILLKRHKCQRFIHYCAQCDLGFMWNQNLVNHVKNVHGVTVSGEAQFACASCERTFFIEGNLKQHMQEMHAVPFKCTTCSKGFRTRSELLEHSCILFLNNM